MPYVNSISDSIYTGNFENEKLPAISVFGQQIICVAKYWLMQNVREATKDTTYDETLQNWVNEYFGSEHPKYEPWCAIFPWFIMKETCELLGVNNDFPGYKQTFGNAYNTFQRALSYWSNTATALPGTIFYRKSKSSGSSGHMGIVISVDQQNEKFYTVEGNIKVDPNNQDIEGVGAWEYDFSDISTLGFNFIRVDNTYTPATAIKEYKGYKCQPEEIIIVTTKPTVETNQGTETTTNEPPPDNTQAVKKTFTVNKPNSNSSSVYTPPTATKKSINPCTTVELPTKDTLKHFIEIEKNRLVVSDIFGCHTSYFNGTYAQRNGSALWYDTYDPGAADPDNSNYFTGFGIFKDNVSDGGNTIYVVDEATTRGKKFLNSEVITSQNPYIITLNGNLGITANDQFRSGAAKKANDFLGLSRVINIDPSFSQYLSSRSYSLQNGAYQPYYYIDSNNILYWNVLAILKNIETTNFKLDRPLLFKIQEKDIADIAAEQFISTIIALSAGLATSNFIPGFELTKSQKEVILNAKNTLTDLVTGKGITFLNVSNYAKSFAQLAELIAPEAVKGASSAVTNWFGSNLNAAKNAINDLFVQSGIKSVVDNVANVLGTSASWVSGLYNNYVEDVNGYAKLLGKSGNEFNINKNVLANAKNIFMMSKFQRSGSGTIKTLVSETMDLTAIPIFQDFFIAGGSDSALPTLPHADKLIAAMFGNQALTGKFSSKPNGQELKAALVGAAFGYIPPKSVFDSFVIESLQYKADEFAKNNLPFIFPDSVPQEKQECYKFEVGKINKITCSNGEIWDSSLRKCVPNKIIVPVERDFSTNNLNIPDLKTTTDKIVTNPVTPNFDPNSLTIKNITNNLKVQLPPCIRIIDGKYYFVEITNVIAPAPQITAIPLNIGKSAMPESFTSVPANVDLPTIQKFNPIVATPQPDNKLTAGLNTDFSAISLPGLQNVSPTSTAALQGGFRLSDNQYEAAAVDLGKPSEKWYAKINNVWKEIRDCKIIEPVTPNVPSFEPDKIKIPNIEIPFIPPVQKKILPVCIEVINGNYYFKFNNDYYEAREDINNPGKFYAFYKNNWLEVINCSVVEPIIPTEPTENTIIPRVPNDPTEPVIPITSTVIPKVPNDPTEPVIPITNTVIPRVPNDPVKPIIPIDNGIIPKIPNNPVKPIIPNNPSNPDDCDCEVKKLQLPKMIEKNEKIIYQYPGCDEKCCDRNEFY